MQWRLAESLSLARSSVPARQAWAIGIISARARDSSSAAD
jgi:hypothetical protein